MQDDQLKIGINGLLIHQQQDKVLHIDAHTEKIIKVIIIVSFNCDIHF